jgi:hypothetical protein
MFLFCLLFLSLFRTPPLVGFSQIYSSASSSSSSEGFLDDNGHGRAGGDVYHRLRSNIANRDAGVARQRGREDDVGRVDPVSRRPSDGLTQRPSPSLLHSDSDDLADDWNNYIDFEPLYRPRPAARRPFHMQEVCYI